LQDPAWNQFQQQSIILSFQAPDALGEVPAATSDVAVKRFVPYHDLVVPRYYELAGYSPHDVYECLHSYVSPALARPLRTGAEVSGR